MFDGGTGHVYKGYQLDVTRRRDDRSMLWTAHFRVGGKLGTVHRGDSGRYSDFLRAEEEAAAKGRQYIDALVNEVPLGTKVTP